MTPTSAAQQNQDRCRTAANQGENQDSAVPENSPNFITVKRWILEAAAESNMVMSVRRAKKMAGDYLDTKDPANYKRLAYNDPVGEGVARRWAEFKHNMQSSAA